MKAMERDLRRQLAQLAADQPGGEILVTTYATPADHRAVCGADADWHAYRDRHDMLKRLAKEYGLSVATVRVDPAAYAEWLGPRRPSPDSVAEYAQQAKPPYRLAMSLGYRDHQLAVGWAMLDLKRSA